MEPGTLSAYVKQNTVTATVDTYAEEYKTNLQYALNVLNRFVVGENYAAARSHIGPIQGGYTNQPPDPPTNKKWVLSGVNVQELEAGEHCTLRLEFQLADSNPDRGVFVRDVSLSWKPQSMPILGFCANDVDHNDRSVNQPNAPIAQTCRSEHIKAYISNPYRQQLSASSSDEVVMLAYQRDGSTVYKLNPRESVLAAKYNEGKEYANYHTPVINIVEETDLLSTDWKSDCPFQDIAEGIDTIANLPYNVIQLQPPIWSTERAWKWILVVDNMQCMFSDDNRKNHRWRRTRQYEGYMKIDENLYGDEKVGQIDGRWYVGGM